MANLRSLHLESFSLAFARKVLEAFPHWMPYVGRYQQVEDGFLVNVLRIEVPSANPDVRQPLTITVDPSREILVSWFPMRSAALWNIDFVFYAYGLSIPDWREDASGFDRMVKWLKEFVAEKRVAAVWSHGWGAPTLDQLAEERARSGEPALVRSWRGIHDVGTTVEAPLPPVIVYGDPDSTLGKLVLACLDGIEVGFGPSFEVPDTDRLILLDPDWNLALMPGAAHYAFADGRRYSIPPEEQGHGRLFIVRWEGDDWSGPWEEEGSFEVRSVGDEALLRRHLRAWLREP